MNVYVAVERGLNSMTPYEIRKSAEAWDYLKKSRDLRKEFKHDWVQSQKVAGKYKPRQSDNSTRRDIILDCLGVINSIQTKITLKLVMGRGLVAFKENKELEVVVNSADLGEILSFVSEKRNALTQKSNPKVLQRVY